jgi:CBS domain-containing protein
MANGENTNSTPLRLFREIAAARSIEELKGLNRRVPDLAGQALDAGIGARKIVRLISRFNDAVTLRLITLLDSCEGIRLPEGATFLVLGSEGRGEQTLRTDQDNAIVYRDDLSPGELPAVKHFADRLVDALETIGVPRCPGDIMASSPRWRHSISEWKSLLDRWIAAPTPEHILCFGMFQDLRALHGDEFPVIRLREHICTAVQCHCCFYPNMANHVVRFPAPFTLFGRIRVEQSGTYKGMVDLKKAGIFAITTGASLLALEFGIIGGDTWEKLALLEKSGFLTHDDSETIISSFTFLVQLRLQQQVRDLDKSREPANCIDPHLMTDGDGRQLRQALKGVNTFLWIFRDHYLLDYTAM